MKCDFNRHRMCNFDGVESSAQFMWRVPRTGSKDFLDFPPLTRTGDAVTLLSIYERLSLLCFVFYHKLLKFVFEAPEFYRTS